MIAAAPLSAQLAVQIAHVRGYMQGSCSGGRHWDSEALQAAGGVESYHWELASGTLPPLIRLELDGTFTTTAKHYLDGGLFCFRVRVTDAAQATDAADISVLVSNGVPACGSGTDDGCRSGASRRPIAWLLAFSACVYAARREAIAEATTS